MTDEKLNALEALCRIEARQDGMVELPASDVLELVHGLRELRHHAVALHALEGAVAAMHRLLANPPAVVTKVSGRVTVQDPGR